jgi:hypothetical protein
LDNRRRTRLVKGGIYTPLSMKALIAPREWRKILEYVLSY